MAAYAQSKAASVLLAVAATAHWSGEGIYANACHPGAIPTGLQKHTGGIKTPEARRKNVQQGAATSVLLATSLLLNNVGGRYFEDCNEAEPIGEDPDPFGGGVSPYVLDPATAERLWTLGLTMLS
jgi:NAD(P)-dependent dehydrogenase (short-subunit alcohol dehydrogenase family)